MSNETEIQEMEREWRRDFKDRLEDLARVQNEMRGTLQELRVGAVDKTDISDLRARIRALEDFKLRAITVIVSLQTILGIGWMIIQHFMSKP